MRFSSQISYFLEKRGVSPADVMWITTTCFITYKGKIVTRFKQFLTSDLVFTARTTVHENEYSNWFIQPGSYILFSLKHIFGKQILWIHSFSNLCFLNKTFYLGNIDYRIYTSIYNNIIKYYNILCNDVRLKFYFMLGPICIVFQLKSKIFLKIVMFLNLHIQLNIKGFMLL